MDINTQIILVIIVTSLATFLSRFLGVLTSEKVKADSKVFQWFNYVAYATLAALLARMIIFPAGVLAEADLILRLIVLISCIMLLETKLISAQETKSLSAIGSSIFPNLEDWLNDLAK